MPGKAVPAVSASSSTVEAEEVEILEAEAVVISGAYPDSVPTADLVATTSSQPVLATRAPKAEGKCREMSKDAARMWATSNPLMEVTCVAVEGVPVDEAAGTAAEPDDAASAPDSDASVGSTAMRIAMQRVLEEDLHNLEENRNSAGYRQFGEITNEEVQRIARQRAAEEISRVRNGPRTEVEETAKTVRIKVPAGASPGTQLTVTFTDEDTGANGLHPTVTITVPPGCQEGDVLRIETRTAHEAEVLAKMARLRAEAEAKLEREAEENTYHESTGEYVYRPPADEPEEEYTYKP